jgi:hypothetical protein
VFFALFAATSVTWACGGAVEMPTGPTAIALEPVANGPVVVSREFPPLNGQWKVDGTAVFRNLDNGMSLTYGSCSGSYVMAQDRERFSGPLQTHGFGWNSDRFCTASGTLNGELLEPDGSVARARFEGNFQNWPRPSVTPSCEVIAAGDGVWTGSAMSEAIRLQIRDTLRCPANVDGGLLNAPMANFERTVSLVFQR